MSRTTTIALAAALALAACATSSPPVEPDGQEAAPDIEAPPIDQSASKVSTSAGEEGGLVVLWPRVIPSAASGELGDIVPRLQGRLKAVSGFADPTRAIDVRPEPQRVCPKAGCKGVATGVLLVRGRDGGCAALAMITPPGPVDTKLVPWVGQFEMASDVIGFREPPESHVVVTDFVPCDQLIERAREAEPELEQAIHAFTSVAR